MRDVRLVNYLENNEICHRGLIICSSTVNQCQHLSNRKMPAPSKRYMTAHTLEMLMDSDSNKNEAKVKCICLFKTEALSESITLAVVLQHVAQLCPATQIQFLA